jgi:hypothetical protein
MQQLGEASARLNSRLSGVCIGGQQSCISTCGALISKYQNLSINCEGCANQSVYDQAIGELMSQKQICGSLDGRVRALANQAAQGAGSAGYADACAQRGSAGGLPALGSSGTGGGSSADMLPDRVAAANGSTGFAANADANSGAAFHDGRSGAAGRDPGFNVGSMAVSNAMPAIPPTPATAPNAAGVIANNTGGAMPGSDANGGARLGSKGTKVSGSAGSVVNVDIMQGERSGGFSASTGGSGLEFDDGAGSANRGRAKDSDQSSGIAGLDLKQFLPGGSRDPNRNLAALGGVRSQINGKGEDIFQLISNKMVEKCKLGVLWRCR